MHIILQFKINSKKTGSGTETDNT